MNIKIKLAPGAQMPRLATNGSAGYDIFPLKGFNDVIGYGDSLIIPTGISMEIPKGKALLILSRSGHGFKKDVRLANCVGLIDSDYRGEIKVKLKSDDLEFNYAELNVDENTAIAQGVFIDYHQVNFDVVEELGDTERGSGGFGSTDKRGLDDLLRTEIDILRGLCRAVYDDFSEDEINRETKSVRDVWLAGKNA